ncbi:MAG: SDR family NAD(P)-dependent oxidoreductase [Flavobacterium sp.]|uniref:SDR family oxidoreductase n=1 Tax=Flavobacterium sp. TaxID=239 RepID=UPI0012243649|nr:SDR family NAD(P)-dependent oxidoreductase [Flavobacterium sp.]RZJ65917.1 MAG: SDR family NAD(P)-dependent oxidoreductase [Flavobacterium sp.]
MKTILITGGGSGIGFEMAKQFSALGNKVIITGRNEERLESAVSQLENARFIQADVTEHNDVERLVETIQRDFPTLNVLINNAGNAQYYKLTDENANAFEKAQEEILTNYLSTIRLTEKLLPTLRKNKNAAIANVSSIVAFVPGITLPTYAASKAALHSYSQSLRLSLTRNNDDIRVFELMPPLVNTEFSKEIGGENGMNPADVAKSLVDAIENDIFEIHPGMTADLYQLYLSSPEAAFNALNN